MVNRSDPDSVSLDLGRAEWQDWPSTLYTAHLKLILSDVERRFNPRPTGWTQIKDTNPGIMYSTINSRTVERHPRPRQEGAVIIARGRVRIHDRRRQAWRHDHKPDTRPRHLWSPGLTMMNLNFLLMRRGQCIMPPLSCWDLRKKTRSKPFRTKDIE
jgi:hypothetical protein